jgi:hypothetical protein
MKKNIFHLAGLLILLLTLTGCGSRKEQIVNLDLLLCESPKDNKLTEQQVQILLPFENDSVRFLQEGCVFNSKDTVIYTKEKGMLDKVTKVQKPLFSIQELTGNHLKALKLSSLALEQPLKVDEAKRYVTNYDFVFGFSSKKADNIPSYISKIFTKNEDVLSYITNEVLVENPDAKILLVYNPPMSDNNSVENPNTTITISDTVKSDSIKVVGVILNKPALSLTTGKSAKLIATVEPFDATNKEVTWKSDNAAVATVGTDGNVKAITEGTTTITVTTVDGNKSAVCKVTVNRTPVPRTISVSGGTYKGEFKKIDGKYIPDGQGVIVYTSRTLIEPRDIKKRYAEAGQSVSGTFKNGHLVIGKLIDTDGRVIDILNIGK